MSKANAPGGNKRAQLPNLRGRNVRHHLNATTEHYKVLQRTNNIYRF